MTQRSFLSKALATLVIVALQALTIPAPAADGAATLSGSILTTADQAPLAGARLHAGDPKSGQVYSSAPASADGSFRIEGLPASTYELAVESEAGLYVVGTPVKLVPGQAQTVSVAVNPQMAPEPQSAQAGNQPAKTSLWNNPATAALIVLGAAVVLGVVIDEATDDDEPAPASP